MTTKTTTTMTTTTMTTTTKRTMTANITTMKTMTMNLRQRSQQQLVHEWVGHAKCTSTFVLKTVSRSFLLEILSQGFVYCLFTPPFDAPHIINSSTLEGGRIRYVNFNMITNKK